MLYFQNEYITIRWDEAARCVMSRHVGFTEGEPLRTAADKVVALLKEKGSRRFLNDISAMRVMSLEDQQWFNEDWFPRAIGAGLRYIAIVVPTSVLANMTVKSVMAQANGLDVRTNYFSDPAAAHQWLRVQA